jgi:hypothetical protein
VSRPLIITDCDEVLLHMVVPFRDWLDEAHDIHFNLENTGFVDALRRKACGTVLEAGEVWTLLRAFFVTEMHRQLPISGALEALERLSDIADIAVLTNIHEEAHERRIDQLRAVGLHHPVHWNQGGKGEPARRLIEAYGATRVVFIDDLAQHHASLARHAPMAWRLHMVGEPLLAPHVERTSMAHARIDGWTEAEQWIRARLTEENAPPRIGVSE